MGPKTSQHDKSIVASRKTKGAHRDRALFPHYLRTKTGTSKAKTEKYGRLREEKKKKRKKPLSELGMRTGFFWKSV